MCIKSFEEHKQIKIEKIHSKAITICLNNHGGHYISYKCNIPIIK